MMLSNHKLMGAIVMLVLAGLLWEKHQTPLPIHQAIGALIAIPAGGLWLVARLQLGKSFSVTAQARHLVTTGLYSKIRNPIYVFGLVLIVGIIVYLGQYWWLFGVIPLLAMQYWRVRAESAVLEAKFGDEYRQYKARTWF
jgi:protein-S-isoprenylcysteine O-methyltransferase Ste14